MKNALLLERDGQARSKDVAASGKRLNGVGAPSRRSDTQRRAGFGEGAATRSEPTMANVMLSAAKHL